MKWLPKQHWMTGLDLGLKTTKVVSLTQIDGYGYFLRSCGIFENKSDALKNYLKNLVNYPVRVNIDASDLIIKRINLPFLPAHELNQAIKYSFKKFVDRSLEGYIFRHDEMKLNVEGKKPYLGYALRKEELEKKISTLKKLGFQNISAVSPSISALGTTYTKNYNHDLPGALIDFGHEQTIFLVLNENGVIFLREIPSISGSALTEQISRDVGLTFDEAEKLKTSPLNDDEDKIIKKVKNTISIFASRIVLEVQRSIDGFYMKSKYTNISQIYCSGGGAYCLDLPSRMEPVIGIKTELIDPFKSVRVDENFISTIKEKRHLFATACGLALGNLNAC